MHPETRQPCECLGEQCRGHHTVDHLHTQLSGQRLGEARHCVGSLRDRLVALVQAEAVSIAEAPMALTAMSWAALGRDLEGLPDVRHTHVADSPELSTLRERIAQQYAAPFDAIIDSPDVAAELGEIDRSRAVALLIGPLVLGRFSTCRTSTTASVPVRPWTASCTCSVYRRPKSPQRVANRQVFEAAYEDRR